MMLGRLDWSSRFMVRLTVTITFFFLLFFTLYDLRGVRSDKSGKSRILPTYDLATPISSNSGNDIEVGGKSYREVFSVSTVDKKYFLIDFLNENGINPNIIPHPTLDATWIVVAQHAKTSLEDQTWFTELGCNAVFVGGILRCTQNPIHLPVASTPGNNCNGDLILFAYSKGPHDARVFYGPEVPYMIFGSNSDYTCFGQFVQDYRSLSDNDWGTSTSAHPGFEVVTEIQRPPPYGAVEKNYFLFWDQDGQVYAHYDIYPNRSFAKLRLDGSTGEDLAPLAVGDKKCMDKYMPIVHTTQEVRESIHQATNSLSITLCKRSDPTCKATDSNTFTFTIFQWKSYWAWHSNYEPYVMVFSQKAPFEILGISKKPFWIHGRGKPNTSTEDHPHGIVERGNTGVTPWNTTEMMYITSMGWKSRYQTNHGFLDDVVFLAFGIEDSRSAGIDILAGDLLSDLGYCNDL